jgi:hypothetical protein
MFRQHAARVGVNLAESDGSHSSSFKAKGESTDSAKQV